MPDDDRSTAGERLTRAHKPGLRLGAAGALILGVVLGTAAAGYIFWSRWHDQHAAETTADPDVAKLPAQECAIAKAALTAVHAAGDDTRWTAAVKATQMTLRAHSLVVNPVDIPGYTDDEADDVRAKPQGDWRACDGMADFVRGFKWTPLSDDIDSAELTLARPGIDKAGDEARVYETFSAPPTSGNPDDPRQKLGPWLVTVKKGANGAWAVTATTALPGGH